MKKVNDKNSNKIKIYQYPLADRILTAFSAISLPFLLISCIITKLYEDYKELLMMLLVLGALLIFAIYAWFLVFKTYICLDKEKNIIEIREFPGTKKEIFSLYGLIDVKVSNDSYSKSKKVFTFDLNYIGYTKKITSWSSGPGSLPLLGGYLRQRKRLEKFVIECNKYIKNK